MNILGLTISEGDIFLLQIATTLFLTIIGAALFRVNKTIIRKKEERDKLIAEILIPFSDAVLNIEKGENHPAFIMNSFFDSQKESICRAKTIAARLKNKQIGKAWNDYEEFYNSNAKGQVLKSFCAIIDADVNGYHTLRQHLKNLIEIISKI